MAGHRVPRRNKTEQKGKKVLARMEREFPASESKSLVTGKISDAVEASGAAGEFKIYALASTIVDQAEQDPDRITGRQVRDGARRGAQVTNARSKQFHQAWQLRAEKIWAGNLSLSKSAVARIIDRSPRRPRQ